MTTYRVRVCCPPHLRRYQLPLAVFRGFGAKNVAWRRRLKLGTRPMLLGLIRYMLFRARVKRSWYDLAYNAPEDEPSQGGPHTGVHLSGHGHEDGERRVLETRPHCSEPLEIGGATDGQHPSLGTGHGISSILQTTADLIDIMQAQQSLGPLGISEVLRSRDATTIMMRMPLTETALNMIRAQHCLPYTRAQQYLPAFTMETPTAAQVDELTAPPLPSELWTTSGSDHDGAQRAHPRARAGHPGCPVVHRRAPVARTRREPTPAKQLSPCSRLGYSMPTALPLPA
jgi:hypothetical protein